MTTQDLYTKVSTGEITEQKFLYEVRRDINLPFITRSNNFTDTVKILKNKGMISEKQTKLSTGKQDVEIISKTIDMVNPYEYSKGMDIELGVANEAVGNVDITEEDIKKAQKKVLKNLTKDPNYYSKKNTATMGDSEYDVEVNAKSIAALEKKNKSKKGKIIREGVNYEREIISYIADTYIQNAKDGDRTYNDFRDLNIRDAVQDVVGILQDPKHPLHRETRKEYQIVSRDKAKGIFELDDDGFASEDERENYYLDLDDVNEHGEDAERVADVNADSTPLEEEEVEELGRLRDSIYEKYAKKYGVDVDELKDKVEARKLEAIEVDNEDTAIAVQKKSPDSDVRIVKR